MKNSLKKIMAGVSAAAMLAAMPAAGVFAADETESAFAVREVEAGVVITNYTDKTAEKIVIPSEIDGKTVVGVDNFAFGLVSQEVTIVVPATLTLDNLDVASFMTAAVVNKGIVEASGATTVNGVVKYWINDVVGMNYTDAQISEAISKAIAHVGDVAVGATLEETALMVVKEIQAGNCGFSDANLERLDLVLKTVPYGLVTLEGPDGTDAQTYAAGKINLKYVVTSGYELGDVTLDGKVNLYDAIEISRYMMKAVELTDEQLAAGDITGDGIVNLYDAIEIAKSLMK